MSAKAHPFLLFGLIAVVGGERKSLGRTLTVSSELVPFQEIDVYAKESCYVKQLNVDYGTHVQADQVLATLEIPGLHGGRDGSRQRSQRPENGPASPTQDDRSNAIS